MRAELMNWTRFVELSDCWNYKTDEILVRVEMFGGLFSAVSTPGDPELADFSAFFEIQKICKPLTSHIAKFQQKRFSHLFKLIRNVQNFHDNVRMLLFFRKGVEKYAIGNTSTCWDDVEFESANLFFGLIRNRNTQRS